MLEPVVGRWARLLEARVTEGTRVRHPLSVRRPGNVSLTAIVLEGDADSPSVLGPEVPRGTHVRLVVCQDAGAEGAEGCSIVVERPIEIFPGRDLLVQRGLAEEVQGEFSLRDEEVPEVTREVRGNPGQYGEEVGLERANGSFSRVTPMHVGGDQLKLGPPRLRYQFLVRRAHFVVEDLKIHVEAPLLDAGHDGVVCDEAVGIAARLKAFGEDGP